MRFIWKGRIMPDYNELYEGYYSDLEDDDFEGDYDLETDTDYDDRNLFLSEEEFFDHLDNL